MNEALEKLAATLEASWNKTDAARLADYKSKVVVGYDHSNRDAFHEYMRGLTQHERNVCLYGAYWYEPQNKKAAAKFAQDLEARLAAKVGDILDIVESATEQSTYSYIVKGSKASAKVSQIWAGGYNIVRLHIRNIIRAL